MGRDSQVDWTAALTVPTPASERDAPPPPLTWRQTALAVLPAFLVTRLVVLVSGIVAIQIWGVKAVQDIYDPAGYTTELGELLSTAIGPLARWDAVWYIDIAEVGYPTDYPPRTAFFPLYPVLLRIGGWFVGSPLVAGLLISLVCAFVGTMLFHRLTDLELGRPAAKAATWALLAFPGSMWFTAVYSEGLFLLLSVGCLLAARQRMWAVAGALGALSAATRSAGIVLMVPLALIAWDQFRQRPRPLDPRAEVGWRQWPWQRPARAVAVVPLGLLAYLAVLRVIGHDWMTSFDQQAEWGRENVGPAVGVLRAIEAAGDGVAQLLGTAPEASAATPGAEWMNPLLLLFLIGGVIALVGVFRRLPLAYGAYVGCALLLPLSAPAVGGGEPLMSLPRFLGVLFPLAMWLGWWIVQSPHARRRGIVLGALGLAMLAGVSMLTARWVFVA
jgi:hypothetical protein